MENKNYTVYMHICPNSKKYIGITKLNPKYRWKNGYGYNDNNHFKNAINKYKWENIDHKILYTNLSKEEAEQKEIELINHYKANNPKFGYNIDNGGNHCGSRSEKTKNKISKNNARFWLNKSRNEETRQKISIANKGKTRTLEQRKKQSELSKGINNNFYGHKMSLSTKNKIIKSNSKKVLCLETKKIYSSITEASKNTNIKIASISYCCNGKRKTAGKFHWKFAKEE